MQRLVSSSPPRQFVDGCTTCSLPHLVKHATCILGLGELACIETDSRKYLLCSCRKNRQCPRGGKASLAQGKVDSRTSGLEHALENRADHGRLAQYHKLEAVTRHECDVLAGSLRRRHAGPMGSGTAAMASKTSESCAGVMMEETEF